jgi:hypothetical protein
MGTPGSVYRITAKRSGTVTILVNRVWADQDACRGWEKSGETCQLRDGKWSAEMVVLSRHVYAGKPVRTPALDGGYVIVLIPPHG